MNLNGDSISIKLIVLLLLIISISCSKQSDYVTIRPLETNNNAFSVKVIKSIPLSNRIEALIGSADRVFVGNNRIIVFDKLQTSSFLIFSESGEFLKRISLGRGPGELVNPNSFSVVDDQLVISDYQYLKYFSLNGEFLNSKKLPLGWTFYSFESFNDKLLLIQGQADSMIKQPQSIVKKFHLVDKALSQCSLSYVEIMDELNAIYETRPMSYYQGKFLLSARPNGYIYQLDEKGLQVKYFVDFGPYNYKEDDLSEGLAHVLELYRGGRRMGLLDKIFENKTLVCFSYANFAEGSDIPVIFSKMTKQSANFYEVLKGEGLPKMKIIQALNNELYCLFFPGEHDDVAIKKYQSRGLLPKETTINSNPILFVIEASN